MNRRPGPSTSMKRQRGAATVEHALIVVGVALVSAAALAVFDLNTLFPDVVARVTTLITP